MATNGKSGDDRRHGAIKNRSQVLNPKIEKWVERNTETGQFMNVKADAAKFKGVRTEK